MSEELNARLPYAFGDELAWFRSTAATLPENAEITFLGGGPGIMVMAVCEGVTKPFHLTVVDINTCHYVQAHLTGLGLDLRKHTFLVADSKTIAWSPPLDFLVVDGDHSYEGVTGDIAVWWERVKPGGLVFFHDVIDMEQNGTNGVRRALDDAKLDADLVATPGISEVYRKR